MAVYYAGLNRSPLLIKGKDGNIVIDKFTEIPFPDITDIEIGWNYFLLWKNEKLYITGKISINDAQTEDDPKLIEVPDSLSGSCKKAIADKESVIILTKENYIWRYKIYENSWKKVPNFIYSMDDAESEYAVEMSQAGCVVVLTNLGRVYNLPVLVDMPKRVKFVDVACGFDHTILLAENGDVYSAGMGIRGQLGHGDLEDCDNPRLIEALAGLEVVQISAGGWHSAVLTNQGDIYTWGWNTNGELGVGTEDTKVVAVPRLIDFKNENGETIEINVKKVQCGNAFTICMMEDGTLWGCGSNKYGQLGQDRENFVDSNIFVKLHVPLDSKNIKDFKCREWGTAIITD